MSWNLCGYELSTLSSCIDTANQLRKKKKINRIEREIINRCPSSTTKQKLEANSLASPLNDALITTYVNNWTTLINSVSERGLSTKFFILPEHPITQYTTKPIGMDQVLEKVLININQLKNVEVFDLRETFSNNQSYKVCELFNNSIHLSEIGKELLTREILSTFIKN